MPIFDKVDGVWKKVSKSYSKVDGVWRTDKNVFDKVDGVWRETHSGAVEWTHSYDRSIDIIDGEFVYETVHGGCNWYQFDSTTTTDLTTNRYMTVNFFFDEPLILPSGSYFDAMVYSGELNDTPGLVSKCSFGLKVNNTCLVSKEPINEIFREDYYTNDYGLSYVAINQISTKIFEESRRAEKGHVYIWVCSPDREIFLLDTSGISENQ